jgi:hypothetical protein
MNEKEDFLIFVEEELNREGQKPLEDKNLI